MGAYYNEIEPFAGQWLANLVAAREITPGCIDPRSIAEVRSTDLDGVTRAHFFAGIGGWDYACRLAGWPDDAPIWTGSCPCQPFSAAGAKRGFADPRHLWPEWARLIGECRPPVIVGEQVSGPAGRGWLDLVFDDLEALGYACAASDLAAASVGAPHIRQRLYWVAVADPGGAGLEERPGIRGDHESELPALERSGGAVRALANNNKAGRGELGAARLHGEGASRDDAPRRSEARGLAEPDIAHSDDRGLQRGGRQLQSETATDLDCWRDAQWIPCADGRARPVEPGTFPLAHGVPARVGRLRGYGNAIVPPLAATFLRAVMGALPR
jgi:DNA (cytosine-5)-methyltransferase 1